MEEISLEFLVKERREIARASDVEAADVVQMEDCSIKIRQVLCNRKTSR